MVMDRLRSCYRSVMRPFRDRPDIQVPGRWYFCAPGAKCLPFPHLFGSSQWDGYELLDDPILGELPGSLGYSKMRRNPLLVGQRFCGAPAVWRNGALYAQAGSPAADSDGTPFCCVTSQSFFGPAAAAGSAPVIYGTGSLATGGVLANGNGLFLSGFAGVGGALLDGAGDFGSGFTARGGMLADGVGLFYSTLFGSGGVLANGHGDFGSGFGTAGGVLADGAGDFGSGYRSAGGVLANGLTNFGSGFTSFGGVLANGTGDFGSGFGTTGGVLADGEGDFSTGSGDVIDIGTIWMYGAASPPTGWLLCDGSAVSRTTYAALFAVIATNFGIGDGSTTFNLPDLRGRSPIGYGAGSGLTNRALGDSGGEETHVITTAEMAAHTHNQAANTYLTTGGVLAIPGGIAMAASVGGVTSSVGSGTAHNTMHPYKCVNFIIKT